uniref:HAT C-terminal dimerisation domain-containing protein n=1 Tax=Graphocephala atropunctata TaxID=36148 RepID=A0A1B6KQY9_9HEMI
MCSPFLKPRMSERGYKTGEIVGSELSKRHRLCKSAEISKCTMKMEKTTTGKMYSYIKKQVEKNIPTFRSCNENLLDSVANCTAERSFSALKRVKTEIRPTI